MDRKAFPHSSKTCIAGIKEIFKQYEAQLSDVKEIKLFEHNLNNTAPWFYDCLVEDRENLIAYLKTKNIGTRIMYPPLNKQLAYNEEGYHPVSEMIGVKGLWLPSAVQLTNFEIEHICKEIRNFYG